MKSKGRCFVSEHVAAPCETCGRRADPCHVFTGALVAAFYCAACCPEHGAPLLADCADFDPGAPKVTL